jgi:O-antigen ligase
MSLLSLNWRPTYIFGVMSVIGGRILGQTRHSGFLFAGMMAFMLVCLLGYLATDEWLLLVVPTGLVMLAWGIWDFRLLYLAIWCTIPFAVEVDLPGGLSTDFPAEPFMWLSCLMFPLFLFLRHKELNFSFVFHPVFILLVIHFFWIIFTSAISEEPLISIKYTLAKSWYIVCFIVIPLLLFKNINDFKTWGLVVVIPLILTVIIILARHSQYGFTFSTINNAVIPIYRNHVDYACCLGILLSIVWFLRKWFENKWIRLFLLISIGLMLTGIYFSYTRAAWLCVPLSIGSYFLIRFRLMRVAVPLALAAGIMIVGWLAYDNHYIGYSPNYEKTITHKNFDDLVSATYNMEDISTVERFYRWVAGYYMVLEKPWAGFGPASFYSVYHSYVDRHFTTYVSDNPEHSGMHNYYLMVAVEQGLIGLVIFLALLISVLLYGEQIYHRMSQGPEKQLLMAMLISFCCGLFILTLNDTIETDKLGTFFLLSISVVIMFGMKQGSKGARGSEE